MTIIFSENEQHANDIKLALSLEVPLIIDERIRVQNLNKLYEWLQSIDAIVNGKLFMDEFIKEICYKGQKEGTYVYSFQGYAISYKTVIDRDKTYTFEFI